MGIIVDIALALLLVIVVFGLVFMLWCLGYSTYLHIKEQKIDLEKKEKELK